MWVDELESVGIINFIYLKKSKNNHSECEICIYINGDDAISKLKKLIGTDVCIEDEKRILMRGKICNFQCATTFSGSKATLKVISYSYEFDKKKYSRIFQDTQKKYKDVINTFCKNGFEVEIINDEFSNTEEENVLVQDKTTDFDFIKKISNNMSNDLFVIDTDRKPMIKIAKHCDYVQKNLDESKIVTFELYKDEFLEVLNIQTSDYLELGQKVDFNGNIYVVVEVNIDFKDGISKNNYKLENTVELKSDLRYTGFLGEGKVKDNKDLDKKGRIQINFLDYEDSMEKNRVWMPYISNLTEEKQGIQLTPDIDEVVNIFCKNGKCYANGCVRKIAFEDKLSDPKNRTLMFKDKYVAFKEDCIEFEAFDNKVLIDNDKLYIEIGDSKMLLNKNNIQIQSSSKIDFKSDKINIDGSNKITAKTSSFDIG